jgi:hypothetical protein
MTDEQATDESLIAQAQFLRSIGVVPPAQVDDDGNVVSPAPADEPEVDDDEHISFDGGAREPPPMPSDPMREHNELVLEILQGWD